MSNLKRLKVLKKLFSYLHDIDYIVILVTFIHVYQNNDIKTKVISGK